MGKRQEEPDEERGSAQYPNYGQRKLRVRNDGLPEWAIRFVAMVAEYCFFWDCLLKNSGWCCAILNADLKVHFKLLNQLPKMFGKWRGKRVEPMNRAEIIFHRPCRRDFLDSERNDR